MNPWAGSMPWIGAMPWVYDAGGPYVIIGLPNDAIPGGIYGVGVYGVGLYPGGWVPDFGGGISSLNTITGGRR